MTKQLFAVLLGGALLFGGLLMPFAANAQNGAIAPNAMPNNCTISKERVSQITAGNNSCPGAGNMASLSNEESICCVFNAIFTVTDWIFFALMALVILFVLIGAFYILTSGGDPTKRDTGRNFLIYAAIGFIVALAARAVPGLTRAVLGV